MNYRAEYDRWLGCEGLTAEERRELEAIRGDDKEIRERFFAPLSFGTAGLRGVMGAGIRRMNATSTSSVRRRNLPGYGRRKRRSSGISPRTAASIAARSSGRPVPVFAEILIIDN